MLLALLWSLPVLMCAINSGCTERDDIVRVDDRSWYGGEVTVEIVLEPRDRGVSVRATWPPEAHDLRMRWSLWFVQGDRIRWTRSSDAHPLSYFERATVGVGDFLAPDSPTREWLECSKPLQAVFDYEIWKGMPGRGELLKKNSVFSEPVVVDLDEVIPYPWAHPIRPENH